MICKDYLSPGGATLGEGGNPNIVFSHLKRDDYIYIQCTIKGRKVAWELKLALSGSEFSCLSIESLSGSAS